MNDMHMHLTVKFWASLKGEHKSCGCCCWSLRKNAQPQGLHRMSHQSRTCTAGESAQATDAHGGSGVIAILDDRRLLLRLDMLVEVDKPWVERRENEAGAETEVDDDSEDEEELDIDADVEAEIEVDAEQVDADADADADVDDDDAVAMARTGTGTGAESDIDASEDSSLDDGVEVATVAGESCVF